MPLALITGASSGLGKELAVQLARQGYSLILTGRNAEALNKLDLSVETMRLSLDLTDKKQREQLLHIIEEKRPDLVINCAGKGLYGNCLDLSIREQLDLIEINLIAVVEITLFAVKLMSKNNQKGTILNISSAASFFSFPLFAAYSASKSFVTNFSRSLHRELKGSGIDVLVSCPGMIDTPFRLRAAKREIKQGSPSISVKKAANLLIKQIEKKKPFTIIDWRVHFLILLSRLFPNKVREEISMRSIEKRLL